MNLKTRYNLYRIKKSLSPSSTFKASLHKNLDKAWEARYGKTLWYQSIGWYQAGAFAAVVLLLVGGGGAYAYSSPEITEGSALYPIKQAIETVEEVTKITPEAKAEFYLKKIERREAEKEILQKKVIVKEIKADIKTREDDIKTEVVGRQRKFLERNLVEKKIKKTEESIEKAEEQLEKISSKNIKLEGQLKIRTEQRIEKIKNKLEIRTDRTRSGEDVK
ncbi:MAG: hypothetical protein KBC69_02445 [Candidatus Magasanikbacteria bacterium]|nr:hypothetical protein [Candidatus Magasanikbacteria bacterium]